MAIKLPDNFRPSDYGVKLSIPKPDVGCKKNEDGSFTLYTRYSRDISDFIKEAAKEMSDKIETELMDELLRLNGYVPERTCKIEACKIGFTEDDEYSIYDYLSCGHVAIRQWPEKTHYCPQCGAKVVW